MWTENSTQWVVGNNTNLQNLSIQLTAFQRKVPYADSTPVIGQCDDWPLLLFKMTTQVPVVKIA